MPSSKSSAAKELIKKLDTWLEEPMRRERLNHATGTNHKVFDVQNRALQTARICGTSQSYVKKLRTGTISTQNKKNPGRRPSILVDSFDKRLLSRVALSFYRRTPPELPTLDTIHEEAISEGFPACLRSTIYRHLKKLGFAFKERDTKMRVYQRMDIVAHRHRVLRQLPKLRANGFKVFYQDETWLNSNHTRKFCWQRELDKSVSRAEINPQDVGGLNVPCGAGQ